MSRRVVIALLVVVGVLGAAAVSQALASEDPVPEQTTVGESGAHWAEMMSMMEPHGIDMADMVSMMESHGVDVAAMMSMMTSDMGGMSGMGSMGQMGTGMDGSMGDMGSDGHADHHGSLDG